MSEENINLGLNAKQCLKSQTGITETIYHDVCTGKLHVVPHGAIDMLLGGILFAFFASVILLVCICIYQVSKS